MTQLIKMLAALTLCASSTSYAETGMNMNTTAKQPNIWAVSKSALAGLRVGITKGATLEAEQGFFGEVDEISGAAHDLGISIGYSKLPPLGIGFVGSITHNTFSAKSWDNLRTLRLEGNGAYSPTEEIYLVAGINAQNVLNSDLDYNTGFGAQFGVGLKISQHLGFEAKYIGTTNTSSSLVTRGSFGSNLKLQMTMLEVGMMGTF